MCKSEEKFKIKEKELITQGPYSCMTIISWGVILLLHRACTLHNATVSTTPYCPLLPISYQLCGNMLFIIWFCLHFLFLYAVYFNHSNGLLCPCEFFNFSSSAFIHMIFLICLFGNYEMPFWVSNQSLHHWVALLENPLGNDIAKEFILKEVSEMDLKTASVFKAPY